MSAWKNLTAARKNLQIREDARHLEDIYSVTIDGEEQGAVDQRTSATMRKWMEGRQDVQATVWTGLRSNWPQKRGGRHFTLQDAIEYLHDIESERDPRRAIRAREYIRNAPSQIQTPLRRMMRVEKRWEDAILPKILFEQAKGDA